MSVPLVSILIPCHNAAPWLATTLESALAQTHPSIEVILVDDGSTDDSVARARAFESRGVRVLTQPCRGASAARNAAAAAARGDYLQFLDADDLLAPDKIARQLARLATAPAGTVASGEWARFHRDPAEAVFTAEPVWRDFPDVVEFYLLHYRSGWMMQPSVWLVPRAVATAAGPWDERLTLNDDGEYFCRVLLASTGVVFCPGARIYYRSGVATSLSRRRDARSLRSLILSIELNTASLRARADSPALRHALADAWQKLAYDLYPDLPAESREAAARARALGGATREWEAGGKMKLLSRFIGWRGAKRVQRLLSSRS